MTTAKGLIQIDNIKLSDDIRIKPFQITWEDFEDCVQVDIEGVGALNYEGKYTKELELEINTNIYNALIKYGELTTHLASDIHYSLNIKQFKKFSQKHGTYFASVDISLFYKKPVKRATAHSLQPTTELITSIILGEIFIIGRNDRTV